MALLIPGRLVVIPWLSDSVRLVLGTQQMVERTSAQTGTFWLMYMLLGVPKIRRVFLSGSVSDPHMVIVEVKTHEHA